MPMGVASMRFAREIPAASTFLICAGGCRYNLDIDACVSLILGSKRLSGLIQLGLEVQPVY